MLRLWNSLSRGFRYNIRETGVRNGTTSLVDEDHERHVSLISTHKTVIRSISSYRDQQSFYKNDKDKQNSYRFRRPNNCEPHLFLEICGLSSAIALGWQYCQLTQLKEERRRLSERKPNVLQTLASVAFAQPRIPHRSQLSILPTKSNVVDPCCGCVTPPSSDGLTSLSVSSDDSFAESNEDTSSESDELQMAMSELSRQLQQGDDLMMAEWQNQAGIELMNSAQNGSTCPQFDYLIPHQSRGQEAVYQREAFLCFRESRKLGSARGAFNLGLCYEQGIGTHINLKKAAECYEEASQKGHTAAKFNLGLLHYHQKLADSNRVTALKLIRQASDEGLLQAQSVLKWMLPQPEGSKMFHRSSTSCLLSIPESESSYGGVQTSTTFRKIHSEPHRICAELSEEMPSESYANQTNTTVTFYLARH